MFLMPVGPLLTVLGFLPSRARTVGTGDILFLLGLGLDLVLFLAGTATPSERDAVDQYVLEIAFLTHSALSSYLSLLAS